LPLPLGRGCINTMFGFSQNNSILLNFSTEFSLFEWHWFFGWSRL